MSNITREAFYDIVGLGLLIGNPVLTSGKVSASLRSRNKLRLRLIFSDTAPGKTYSMCLDFSSLSQRCHIGAFMYFSAEHFPGNEVLAKF